MTLTELQSRIIGYHELPGHGVGGPLHIVVDDSNLEDDSIQWCLDNAESWYQEWCDVPVTDAMRRETNEIGEALLALSPAMRCFAVGSDPGSEITSELNMLTNGWDYMQWDDPDERESLASSLRWVLELLQP